MYLTNKEVKDYIVGESYISRVELKVKYYLEKGRELLGGVSAIFNSRYNEYY